MTDKPYNPFPGYADDIQIPEGFVDSSWHNDLCPSFTNRELGLLLYIDHMDPKEREYDDTKRFSLQGLDGEGCLLNDGQSILEADTLQDVVTFINKLKEKPRGK